MKLVLLTLSIMRLKIKYVLYYLSGFLHEQFIEKEPVE